MNRFTLYFDTERINPHDEIEGIAAILDENSPLSAIEQFKLKSRSGWAEVINNFHFINGGLRVKGGYSDCTPHFSCYLPLTDEAVVIFTFKIVGIFKGGRLIGVSHYA